MRPPLWHRQLQLRAGHVHPTAAGLQKSSAIFAIFLQTVIEVLLLASFLFCFFVVLVLFAQRCNTTLSEYRALLE